VAVRARAALGRRARVRTAAQRLIQIQIQNILVTQVKPATSC
jgi:hypothetical protein